jgi:hypothetical protein
LGLKRKLETSIILILIVLASQISLFPAEASEDTAIKQRVANVSKAVEEIRELNFPRQLPVETISRGEVAEVLNFSAWEGWKLTQQEYEALYLLSEDEDVREVYQSFYSSALLGYYDSKLDKIVIVTNGEELLDKETLAHELTHALLDQYYPEAFEAEYNMTDQSLASSSILEGDAELVEEIYAAGLSAGEYEDCELRLDTVNEFSQAHLAIIYIQLFPYLEGYNLVKNLRERGGWTAVNRAYINPPESTEQVIHPEKFPEEKPVRVDISGRKFKGWNWLGDDILGEAVIFMMFWDKGLAGFTYSVEGRVSYKSTYSDGWAGDRMAVYEKNERYGYVWVILWDTEADALEFEAGYTLLLLRIGAEQIGEVWRIDENDYLIINREGKKITIVNAPSPWELDDILMAANLPIVKIKDFSIEDFETQPIIHISLKNLTPENQHATVIVQIKDFNGRVKALFCVSGSVSANESREFNVYLHRELENCRVELYVWRSLGDPTPIAKPQTLTVATP